MKKKNSIQEAADLVSKLDYEARQRIITGIEKKDPQMAEEIDNNMVSLEDLQHITVKMLQDLLKEITADCLGRALRMGSRELQQFVLKHVSSSLARDIRDILNGPPQKKTDVARDVDHIVSLMRKKIQTKEIVFGKKDEYV